MRLYTIHHRDEMKRETECKKEGTREREWKGMIR
jgi:hypothetical protein